jgi:hypothetical protein
VFVAERPDVSRVSFRPVLREILSASPDAGSSFPVRVLHRRCRETASLHGIGGVSGQCKSFVQVEQLASRERLIEGSLIQGAAHHCDHEISIVCIHPCRVVAGAGTYGFDSPEEHRASFSQSCVGKSSRHRMEPDQSGGDVAVGRLEAQHQAQSLQRQCDVSDFECDLGRDP